MAAFWRRLAAAAAALAVATAPGGAASPDPASLRVTAEETARARVLVRRLGSEIFQERDEATRELGAMGRRALVALDEARGDADPEVSARVGQLYPRATLDEVGARAATFLADADGRYEHDIPGWPKFRAALGDDPVSRALFAEIVADKDNYELLAALGGAQASLTPGLTALAGGAAALRVESGPPDAVRRALAARQQSLASALGVGRSGQPFGRSVGLPQVALVLLGESHAPEPHTPNGTRPDVTHLFNVPGVREAMLGGHKYSPALRQLTWLWVESRPAPAGPGVGLIVGNALRLDPTRLAVTAARALRQPALQPHERVQALNVLNQAKGRQHLATVTTAFADERALIRQAAVGGYDILVCDYALSVALQLTGQRPEDYGLTLSAPLKDAQRLTYMSYHFLGGPKATAGQKRLAAFDRWRAFEADQLGSVAGGALGQRVTAARLPRGVAKADPKVIVVED